MPLLEIIHAQCQVSATIRLDESSAEQIDQYAAVLCASADEVVDTALAHVFAKDLQQPLKSPEASHVPQTLRIRQMQQSGAASESGSGAVKPVKRT